MTFNRFLAGILLAPAVTAAAIVPARPALAQPADFRAQADAMLAAAYPADGPGAAVVVMRGGRVIYVGARGLADVETRRPITPDSVFRLGSIVKQFTAATVLQLVAEGRISLDDPIARFFPDWAQPGAGATVRQLLNHSSGIQDFTKIPGFMLSPPTLRPNSTADLIAVTRGRPSVSDPGTRWEYNNGGYVVLGAIIEQVTGQAWHVAIVNRIARPLGLDSIAYADAPPRAEWVSGYSLAEGQYRLARGVHISVAHAAGGLVGSVGDMAHWAQALHQGGVVSPALYQEMTRPAQLADGSTRPYGFGLRLQRLRGREMMVHGGAGRGLDTDSVYIPSEDLFVAVFANTDDPATDPSLVTRRLAALAMGEPFPVLTRTDVPLPAIEPLFGAYHAEGAPPLRFFARDGRLFLAHGDEEMEAFAAGDDRFFFGPERLVWVRFLRQADGAHVMEAHEPDAAQPARAVRTGVVPPPLTVPAAVLQSYVGTYQTETLAVTIALGDNGWLTVTRAGQEPMPMRPVSETEFRIDGTPMRLVFHPEAGAVDRFTLYRGARELHGRRTGR